MTFKINAQTEREMRWQSSPLRYLTDQVIKAYNDWHDQDVRVGDNAATRRIVGAAGDLANLRGEIFEGKRDGLGYPITEEEK